MSLLAVSRKFLVRCKSSFGLSPNSCSCYGTNQSGRSISTVSKCSKHGPGCPCGRLSTTIVPKFVPQSHTRPTQVRLFGSGRPESSSLNAKSDPITSLTRQLDQEMKIEAEEHEYRKEITSGSQKLPDELSQLLEETGFKLVSKPGESVVDLQKESNNEIVRVEFDVEQVYNNNSYDVDQEMENEEVQDEDSQVVSYQLTMTVERKDTHDALKVDVWLHDEYCELHGFRYVPGNLLKESESQQPGAKRMYSGPSVEDLDEELQESLSNYVVSKGINDTLYEFLVNYSNFKESAEYYQWCQNVKKFLAGTKV